VKRVLGIAALVALAGACGNDSKCADLNAKLQKCGLVPQGSQFSCTEPTSDEECAASCALNASCSDLKDSACSNITSTTIQACYVECRTESPQFTCKDGTSVPASYRCDGSPDCDDGSDETGCPTFTCQDGATVQADFRCDGMDDCDDGSDETGCPTFTCQDGAKIPADDRCSGEPECSDGSDETGCLPNIADLLICS
jgi:hypothetical protein